MQLRLDDEDRQVALGECLGRALQGRGRVHLSGELGAGKTTLARGVLRAYGHQGAVKSPTYTLVEPYELSLDGEPVTLHHFDLYRLTDPDEAYEIGLDEALDGGVALIEWPQRLEGRLPPNRLDIDIALDGDARRAVLVAHGGFEGRSLEF